MEITVASESAGFEDTKETDLIIKINGMVLLLRNFSDWKFGIVVGVDILRLFGWTVTVVWLLYCMEWYGFGDF